MSGERGFHTQRFPGTVVRFAIFSGTPPSDNQIADIRERGLGLRLDNLRDEYLDLTFLRSYSDFLTHLSIRDARCRDIRPVLDLGLLQWLDLDTRQKTDVDLTQLGNLEAFEGKHSRFESVVERPKLRRLVLRRVRGTDLGTVRGPLEYLELLGARKLQNVPFLDQPLKLDLLRIRGLKQLDLTNLARCEHLRVLSLERCASITSLDRTLDLPDLKTIELDGCRELRPRDSLLQVGAVDVTVLGKNPFDADFQVAAYRSAANWDFFHANTSGPHFMRHAAKRSVRKKAYELIDHLMDEFDREDLYSETSTLPDAAIDLGAGVDEIQSMEASSWYWKPTPPALQGRAAIRSAIRVEMPKARELGYLSTYETLKELLELFEAIDQGDGLSYRAETWGNDRG